jgi:hypothetical protein
MPPRRRYSFPSSRPSSSSVLRRKPLLPRPTQNAPSSASPQLEIPDCTTCLKPDPSMHHSGFDSLDCRDGDPTVSHRITEIRAWARLSSLLTVAPSILPAIRLSDCDSGVLPLAFHSCGMTWPIEEMPHDNVASFCLAPPRIT